MHKFIEYISDLLFLHDCVIIPDFGGFICNYRSAFIDESNGMICPPTKDVLFNRNLTHNDGLLTNWIASKESISYEKASSQLILFCEELKIKLNQRQRVAFGDIGVFYTDRRFNVIFEAGRNDFFAESLGMEPVGISSVSAEAKPVQITMPTSTLSNADGLSYMNIEGTSGNLLHRLLKYGLAVAVVAGIAVISQLDIFHSDVPGVITNASTIKPELPSIPTNASETNVHHSVISPDYDYVDYDPIYDLYQQ